MQFDLKEYRSALGSFATGVTVVTAIDADGNGHGLTVNSFTSVSLDPPLVLWCLGNRSDSYDLFSKADAYGINILGAGQTDFAMRFAGKGDQRLDITEFETLETGSPVLSQAIATFDCVVIDRVKAGDHLILIGQTKAYCTSPDGAMTYFRGTFGATDALSRT